MKCEDQLTPTKTHKHINFDVFSLFQIYLWAGLMEHMNLVDVEVVNPVIKHVVEVVEELNDLVRRAVGADGGEAYDVAEEDRGCLEHLRLRHLSWGKILSQEIFLNSVNLS